MIEVTRLNGTRFYLNADHIETVEAAPDTTITMTSGKHYVVRETVLIVVERIIAYQRRIHSVIVSEGGAEQEKLHELIPKRPAGEEVETASEIGTLPD